MSNVLGTHLRPPVGTTLPQIWLFAALLILEVFCSAPLLSQVLRPGYAGNAACTSCHQQQASAYLHTSHYLTSQLPSSHSILGNLSPPGNRLVISDPALDPSQPGLAFTVAEKNGTFYQTAITGWPPDLQTRTEPIGIVTGSGTRGQTYLYWQDDSLFELPVSFWTQGHRWINSPGYTDGTADFSRPVHPGCLECHASWIQPLTDDPATNQFARDTFVPGIGCETCHGPGLQHIQQMRAAPAQPASAPSAILNPAAFSRDRQIDLCALCHNGIARQPLAPAFSSMPGKPLGRYFGPLPSLSSDTPPPDRPDVHGNQVGLLERSKCFLSSPQMTCSTCHDVHAPERSAASYSSRCLTCHTWQSCGASKRLGHSIASNCIDCHMPVQPTSVIVSSTAGVRIQATIRTHWIKVYPGARLAKGTTASPAHPPQN